VLYGDVEDEELYERLPLATAKWVVGTARRLDFNRALMQGVKSVGWDGHVALAAEHEEEVEELDRLGAHVVLRPYEDGAELAAEAITDAADLRLHLSGWPVAFREIRVRADSVCAGKTIKELSLRNRTGATIVALSRAGRVTFDPPPELQIFPNDRLLIMGRDDELEQAEAYLETRRSGDEEARTHFDVGQFEVLSESEIAGKSLAELGFRNRFGTTVVGIERAQERVVVPGPKEVIQVGDVLVVIGLRDRVRALENVPGIRRIG
jgi:K+/H+ antiporter YhaU regulatory subunit KhtT